MNNQTQKSIFHHTEFSRLDEILWKREQKGSDVPIFINTWNNESTIGKTVILLRAEQHRYSFLKGLFVFDNDSTDHTREIAAAFGATVYRSSEILPKMDKKPGKGVGQWKALSKTQGDIMVFIDGAISNIQPDLIYGLIAPLILYDHLKYIKAFYDQKISERRILAGKQCLTKYLIQPMFSIFFPDLLSIIQPLSGMYAWKHDLENMPFSPGDGEVGQLLDVYRAEGLSAIGQVDLGRVEFREESPKDPQKMSVDILSAMLSRISPLEYEKKVSAIQDEDCPPLRTLREYQRQLTKPSPDFVNQHRTQDVSVSPSMKEKTGTYS